MPRVNSPEPMETFLLDMHLQDEERSSSPDLIFPITGISSAPRSQSTPSADCANQPENHPFKDPGASAAPQSHFRKRASESPSPGDRSATKSKRSAGSGADKRSDSFEGWFDATCAESKPMDVSSDLPCSATAISALDNAQRAVLIAAHIEHTNRFGVPRGNGSCIGCGLDAITLQNETGPTRIRAENLIARFVEASGLGAQTKTCSPADAAAQPVAKAPSTWVINLYQPILQINDITKEMLDETLILLRDIGNPGSEDGGGFERSLADLLAFQLIRLCEKHTSVCVKDAVGQIKCEPEHEEMLKRGERIFRELHTSRAEDL
jgi:hypothetical protein